ncbi:hypothetical protein Ae168Ps1_2342 [Pseudonocardia sp. Ae168_Ps1]|nr:hypothetical protein Ae168Ps1_2342 [Pseudonocardia sp. Ae168_Ps1]
MLLPAALHDPNASETGRPPVRRDRRRPPVRGRERHTPCPATVLRHLIPNVSGPPSRDDGAGRSVTLKVVRGTATGRPCRHALPEGPRRPVRCCTLAPAGS